MILTTDLGLEKVNVFKTSSLSPLDQHATNSAHGPLAAPEAHTLDERRALAGCYYLTSIISTSVSVLTPLQYGPQLEETCRLFEGSDQRSTDFRLSKMIRLQHLISRIHQIHRDADVSDGYHSIPVEIHIRAFLKDLARFWDNLPLALHFDGKHPSHS